MSLNKKLIEIIQSDELYDLVEIVSLIDQGADVNKFDSNGVSPFIELMESGDYKTNWLAVILTFLQAGGNPFHSANFGANPTLSPIRVLLGYGINKPPQCSKNIRNFILKMFIRTFNGDEAQKHEYNYRMLTEICTMPESRGTSRSSHYDDLFDDILTELIRCKFMTNDMYQALYDSVTVTNGNCLYRAKWLLVNAPRFNYTLKSLDDETFRIIKTISDEIPMDHREATPIYQFYSAYIAMN
jgi:hypothetical protein